MTKKAAYMANTTTLTPSDMQLVEVKAFVKERYLDGGLIVGFDFRTGKIEAVSYGRDRKLCGRLGRILGRVLKAIEAGELNVS